MSSDMEDKDNLKVDSNYLGSPQTQAYLIIRQQQRHQPCQGDRNIIGTFDGLGHWRDDRSNLTAPQVLESITERAKIRKEIEMTVLDINGRVIPGQVADYALTGKPGEKRWLPFVEGPLLGTFDTEGIWRLDRGRLATRTRREISIILDHEWFDNPHGLFHKYFEPVDPTRMFNETLPIGHLRRSPIGKPGHKMLYNFPVDGTTLGTFDSTGTWRADTGKYATMTRNEIQLAVQKDLDSVASGKVKGADVYKKKKDEFVGKKGEQCLVKFNFGNMLGTFGKDGVWTANTGRFQGLGRKRIQKLLDLEGKRYKYFNVPKFSDLTVEQKLGIHTGNFQGNPGSKCLVIFPLIGQVYGTFNRHGIWIADSGKYSGQSKQSIQKEVDKKISKESKGKLCGDPGTFRTVEFVGEGPIEGVFSALGKWSAISGRYAGMDKAEIEKCILEEINTSSPALVNEDNSDIPVHENPQYNLFELLDWDNMASSYVGIHDPRKPYPGKKHTFKFPALGPLHGNFDLNNVWIVNSGRFQGKSKKDMCDLLIILKNRIISGKIKLKPEMIAIPETPASQAEKLLEIEDDPNCNVRELLSDNFDAMPRDEPSFKNIYYGKRYTYNFPCVGPVLGFYDEKRKWRSAIGRFAGKTKEDIVATLYQKHARLRGEMIAMDTETLEKTEQRKRHAETWNAQMTDQELDTGLKIEDDPRYNLRELLENNFSCILNEEPSSTEPGMTYTYIFACIGPVTGTFDDNNVWLADSGQFMGKPKRIIKIFLNNLRRKLDRGVIKLNTKNEIDQRHREQMYLGPGPKRSRLDESPLPEPSFKTPVHEVSFRTPIPEASFKTPIPTSASFMHPITISKDAFSESDNFRRRIHIQDKIPTPSLPTPVPPPSNYPVMVPPPREFVSRSGTSDNFNAYDSSFHPRETRLNQNAYDESWGPESSRSSGLPSQSRVSVPDDSDRPFTSRDLAMPQDFEIRRNSLPERFDTSRHNFCDIPSSSRDLSNHSDWNQAHVSSVKSGPGMSLEMGIPSDRYLGSRDLPEQPSGLPFNSSDEIHHASHLGANARPDQQPNNRRPSVFQEYVDQLKGKETHNLLTTDKPQSLMSIQIPDNVAHKANFLLPSSSSSVLPESFAVGSEDCGNHRSQDTMWYENKLKSHLEAAKEKLSDAKYQRHIAKNPPPQEGEEKPKKRFDFKAQLEKLKQMTPILDPKLLNIAAPPEASEKKGKKKQQTETLGSSLPPVPKLPSQRPADKEFDGDIYYLVQKKTNEGPEEQWISPVQFAFDAITSEALEKTNELFQGWAKTIHYTKLELNGLGVICTSKTEPERVMTYLDIVSKIRKFDYQFKVFSKETVLNHYAVTIFMNQRLKHLRTPRVMKMLKADNPNIPGDPEVLVIKEFDGDNASAPKAMIKTFALLIDGDNDFFSWLAREPVGRRYKCWRDSVEIKGGWRAGPTQQQWESLGIDQHVIDMILASNMDEILQACLDEEELSVKDKASLRKQLNARKLFMSDVRQSVNFTDFQERRKAREAQMTKMKDTGVTGIGQSIVEGTSSEHMDIDSSLADEDLDVQEDFNVPDNFSTLPNYNPKEAAYIINDVPDANPVGSESNIITIFLQRHHQIRLHAILDIIMKKNPELKGSFEIIAVEEFQESDIDEFGKSLRGCRLLTCEGDEEFMQSLYPFHNRSWFVMFSRAGDIQIRGGKRDPNATPIKQKKVKKINKGSANNAGKEQHEHEPAV